MQMQVTVSKFVGGSSGLSLHLCCCELLPSISRDSSTNFWSHAPLSTNMYNYPGMYAF